MLSCSNWWTNRPSLVFYCIWYLKLEECHICQRLTGIRLRQIYVFILKMQNKIWEHHISLNLSNQIISRKSKKSSLFRLTLRCALYPFLTGCPVTPDRLYLDWWPLTPWTDQSCTAPSSADACHKLSRWALPLTKRKRPPLVDRHALRGHVSVQQRRWREPRAVIFQWDRRTHTNSQTKPDINTGRQTLPDTGTDKQKCQVG